MRKHHPDNERVKRRYCDYLREAKRQSEATVDAVAKALARFEEENGYRDFKSFHHQQAIRFKRRLVEQDSQVTGEKLSKSTVYATLSHLSRFFHWLAGQPGYKSKLSYSDSDYFNLSEKDARVAKAKRERPFPTLEQVKHVIANMPHGTEIERRDRAVVAFTLLTGARDGAIASAKLKHVDLVEKCFRQDARDVRTKFSKSFTTYFFPVGGDVEQIVTDWVEYLRDIKLWGHDDPLFPATLVTVGADRRFAAAGLKREHWSNADPVRKVFHAAFEGAGLPYFNPHCIRNTLVRFGEARCQTPEEFKAWSQNLGHEKVLTTFTCYGEVQAHRQGEIIRGLTAPSSESRTEVDELAKAIARELHRRASSSDEQDTA
jgi:integrase